jgi:hypothetical protein
MKTTRRFPAAALLGFALLAGCGDLIVDGGARQVTGLTVEDAGGATLATVAGGEVSGTVSVARGARRTLVIRLRGAAGPISPTLDETVRVTLTNPGVASWEDTGSGTGVLRGNSTGATTLTVDLLRGGSAAYTSPRIPVVVN